jgi:hypothetical protein
MIVEMTKQIPKKTPENRNITSMVKTKPIHKGPRNSNKDDEIYKENSNNKDSERNSMKDENSSSKNPNTIPKNAFKKKTNIIQIIDITPSSKPKNNPIHKDSKEKYNSMNEKSSEKYNPMNDNSYDLIQDESGCNLNHIDNSMKDENNLPENPSVIIDQSIEGFIKKLKNSQQNIKYMRFEFKRTTDKKILIRYIWTRKKDEIPNVTDLLNQIINNIKEQFSEYEFILLIDKRSKSNDEITKYTKENKCAFGVNVVSRYCYANFTLKSVIPSELEKEKIKTLIEELKTAEHGQYGEFKFTATEHKNILIKYPWRQINGKNTKGKIPNIIDLLNQIIHNIEGYFPKHKFILLIDKVNKSNDEITKYTKENECAFEVNAVNHNYCQEFKLKPVIPNELDQKKIEDLIDKLEHSECAQYMEFEFKPTTDKKILIRYIWTNKKDQISNIIDLLNQIINNIKEQFSEYEFILLIDKRNKLNDKIMEYVQKQNSAFKANVVNGYYYANFTPESVIPNKLDKEKSKHLSVNLKPEDMGNTGNLNLNQQ